MGWSLGYDGRWDRDIGYGVPAYCDHPKCNAEIDRGLSNVCGSEQPYGGELGCGLYFCGEHHNGYRREEYNLCPRCTAGKDPYKRPKPDHPVWIAFKLMDESWAEWRAENPKKVEALTAALAANPLTPAMQETLDFELACSAAHEAVPHG